MKAFKDESTEGNEKAFRRGPRVPNGDVNLAWVDAPTLNPKDNIIVIDTTNLTPENAGERSQKCRIFTANQYGILEDYVTGDDLVQEEYPIVADTFSVDEDWSVVPGSEYSSNSILGYVHVSRYFHVDNIGLASPNLFKVVDGILNEIKVVDSNGNDYLDANGQRRYRIALTEVPGVRNNYSDTQTAYRVWAYVDTDTNEGLYLKYNKVELTNQNLVRRQNINHKEILNPRAYYTFVPEETEVQDDSNRNKRIYTTKSVFTKEKILGKEVSGKDGYRVYVPKKAIPDPRLFQIFRWRIACDVSEKLVIDPVRSSYVIKAGVLQVGNEVDDCAPYVFYNLELSDYNVGGLKFVNPLIETRLHDDSGVDSRKNRRDYWTVNFDTISYQDLAKFDILFLHPGSKSTIDMSKYMAKIKYFTEVCGGTIVIETGTHVYVTGTGVSTTASVNAVDGTSLTPGPQGWAYGDSIFVPTAAKSDSRFNGSRLGGWDFSATPAAYESIHPAQVGLMYYWTVGRGKTNYITSKPIGWTSLVQIKRNNLITYDKLVVKDFENGGSLYFSNQLFGSALEDPESGQRISWNRGDTAFISPDYQEYVSSWTVEGNYKLLYNMVLKAISRRLIDSTDLTSTSSNWSLYSPWKASWIIDGEVLAESERNTNDIILHSKSLDDPDMTWVRMLGEGKTVKDIFEEAQDGDALRKIEGMDRIYRIETSNPYVETIPDDDINDLDGIVVPYAWTDAYSPSFTVPPEIGAHIIEEEPTMDGYQSAQLIHKSYPPKPYGMRADIIGVDSHQALVEHTINWSVDGTALRSSVINTIAPFNWRNSGGNEWYTYDTSDGRFAGSKGLTVPKGLDVMSQANYNSYKMPVFPSFGAFEILNVGSYGELVSFVQRAMNYFVFFGYLSADPVVEDGIYGPLTKATVQNFQFEHGCRVDTGGVVDAETWAAIGNQCLRLDHLWEVNRGYPVPEDMPDAGLWHRWFGAPRKKMTRPHISDGSGGQPFIMQSPMSNSPQYVFDVFQFSLQYPAEIMGIGVMPYTEGLSNTVRIEAIDVHNRWNEGDFWTMVQGSILTNYPVGRMRVPLKRVVRDGELVKIPVGPWVGDTVTVAIGQDQPSGRGHSRIFGIRDIVVYTKTQGFQTLPVGITASGTLTIKTGEEKVIDLKPDAASAAGGQLFDITWGAITITPDESEEELYYSLSEDGTKLIIRNIDVQNGTSETVHFGKPLTTYDKEVDAELNPGNWPRSTWYSMDENGRLNPGREMGYISKTDGIKIFCDSTKKPVGFPANAQGIGPRGDIQRHYALLNIAPLDVDPSVMVGFYDFAKKEFILDKHGLPRMTFIEYLDRGPQNVFLAAISNYEEQKLQDVGADSAPPIPFKWAKPVYGLCFRSGSQIGIDTFPENLGPTDFWSVPIRTGTFTRQVKIPSRPTLPLTSWSASYQGRTLTAFYSVPEANNAGWSLIHGRPYIDIIDESPIIISDNVIQVRQSPIHMVQEPAAFTSYADPVFPVIRIWTREAETDSWDELSRLDIKDFNASNGVIMLKYPLVSANPNLIKVSYTTARASFQFKKSPDGKILNLNPYPGHSRDLVGRGVYIYINPTYVKDENGIIIEESVMPTALNIAFNDNLFNPLSPDYDPLMVHLGTIFVTTALDINELKIMDTRRRGGGAPDTMSMEDIRSSSSEGAYYWDVAPGSGIGYQQGGFVVIRLPEALKLQFTKDEIITIIDRNITAGVRYRIETTDGSDW